MRSARLIHPRPDVALVQGLVAVRRWRKEVEVLAPFLSQDA